jgi:hypothetical protein
VLRYCREFHCLPSQLYAEDAELLRLIAIEKHGLTEGEGVGTDGQ